ncbi:MAG: hypothetical protein LAN71_17790 [Acidobacteriia bacterium]|nr:hypothetical protein [Terriglobia bacterium]
MDDIYTHTYDFSVGVNGEKSITGEAEFNTDGLASYKITSSSDPLPHGTLQFFIEVMDLIHKIYKETGGIKLLRVKRKVV